LYDTKDPAYVAAVMDAVLSDAAMQDEIVRGQLAALERLQSKDFTRTLLRFVEHAIGAPPSGQRTLADR